MHHTNDIILWADIVLTSIVVTILMILANRGAK